MLRFRRDLQERRPVSELCAAQREIRQRKVCALARCADRIALTKGHEGGDLAHGAGRVMRLLSTARDVEEASEA